MMTLLATLSIVAIVVFAFLSFITYRLSQMLDDEDRQDGWF